MAHKTHAQNAAAKMTDLELLQTATTIQAEALAYMASGRPATHAFVGMVELLTACCEELVDRGYERGHKRGHVPFRDVSWIDDNDGRGPCKLQNPIRVF